MDKAVIAKVQALGFDVWMRREQDSWLYFVDPFSQRIGYLQENSGGTGGGFTLCTVHKPNTTTGTGFVMHQCVGDFTRDDLLSCFATAPAWAFERDRATVKKYKGMSELRARGSFESEYAKMELVHG